jgi:multimeric flavodoxin WrbA
MKNLLIVYESRTGNTEAMAKAVQAGAVSAGANVKMQRATEANMDDLLACDAVIFGSPTNFGYMAGTLKEFFDQVWFTQRKKEIKKPYAAFSIALGMAAPTLQSIDHVCQEFVSKWSKFKFEKICDGVAAARQPSPEVLEQCQELGRKVAKA